MPTIFDRAEAWFDTYRIRRKFRPLLRVVESIRRRIALFSLYSTRQIINENVSLQRKIKESPAHAARFFVDALALASVVSRRLLGFEPNITQLAAAILLCEGKVVELRAGEGKTIVAMLAAYWKALKGLHVHIATTNDYLAERDHGWMGLPLRMLGLETGVVISTTPRDKRQVEYAKHITYAANQELGFDYMRDHLVMDADDQVLKNLDFVIIDEIDSILIDEARTSLIISQLQEKKQDVERRTAEFVQMRRFLEIVKKLEVNKDYTVDYRSHSVAFTDQGIAKIVKETGRDFFAAGDLTRMRQIWCALYVSVFLEPDRDYIVKNNKVILIDEFTGHPLPDRMYMYGIQQALEAEANIVPSEENLVLASITYRSFFKLYRGIAGMTGTAYEARDEFWDLYGLEVALLPPHRKLWRKDLPTVFFRSEEDKLNKVADVSRRTIIEKTPLLIVGRSIAAAKKISAFLGARAIAHQLLHAEISEHEFAIIEAAGKPGVITVATNMAGRGADIIIEESVRRSLGLQVLGFEHNLSRRVDEQLRGRAGRQGQVGASQFFASLEDELLQVYGDDEFWDYAETLDWRPEGVVDPSLQKGVERAQKRAQSNEAQTRANLARFDQVIDHYRKTIYALRSAILLSSFYPQAIIKEISHILRRESKPPASREDLADLLRQEVMDQSKLARVQDAIFGGSASFFGKINETAPLYIDVKKEILSGIDSLWQQYLENLDWLQDWVSLVSVGGEDPHVVFVETSSRMFHDLRRTFALTALRSIIKLV